MEETSLKNTPGFQHQLLAHYNNNLLSGVGGIITASLILGFSAIRLLYLGHLQMMSIAWVVLALLCLVKLSKKMSLFFNS